MAARPSELRLFILDQLSGGPVAREELLDRAGRLIPPGVAIRRYEQNLAHQRATGNGEPMRRIFEGRINSDRTLHDPADKILFGRRAIVLGMLKQLRYKNVVTIERHEGLDFYSLVEYTHPINEPEWCLHCGSDTCEHALRHNAAYGRAAMGFDFEVVDDAERDPTEAPRG